VLVFTRTKHGANRLAQQLRGDGLLATAIHGNKTQSARTRALAEFKDGTVRVLVATDIAARGLDIDRLPHVVNYELPHVPEDYVHRIGRTGRAGQQGLAISLVSADEYAQLREIERLLDYRIPQETMPGYETRMPLLPRHVTEARKPRGGQRRSGRPLANRVFGQGG
jgi:ATP-dependent RNA helicase RhlE